MTDALRSPPQPAARSVRGLAADAGLRTRDCLARLSERGLPVHKGSRTLAGAELARARAILGLGGAEPEPQAPPARSDLDDAGLTVRLLRPLRGKGKLGRTRTTAIENLYGHGIPDHQKVHAKALVEDLVREGALAEKPSQGRRHVWLTAHGLQVLEHAEGPTREDA